MNAVLVDTNVILDIAAYDPRWAQWSLNRVDALKLEARRLVIAPAIYAELAAGYDSQEKLDDAVEKLAFEYEETPKPALFLAGQIFVEYRRRGGTRTSPLSDFFIGAHAQVHGYEILTRDTDKYRTEFPRVRLLHPR